MDDFVIWSYSRRQAIEDGVLVDLTPLARELGFKVSVAVTSAVWIACIAGPCSTSGEDQAGRSRSILGRLRQSVLWNPDVSDAFFSLLVQKDTPFEAVQTLKATMRPGDDWEPVITLMFTDED